MISVLKGRFRNTFFAAQQGHFAGLAVEGNVNVGVRDGIFFNEEGDGGMCCIDAIGLDGEFQAACNKELFVVAIDGDGRRFLRGTATDELGSGHGETTVVVDALVDVLNLESLVVGLETRIGCILGRFVGKNFIGQMSLECLLEKLRVEGD